MAYSEFSLIDEYFKNRTLIREDVVLGIGDDAAVTAIPPGYELVTAVDTLVNNVHFPKDTQAFDIGYKSLAVNLSDMAAMGAEPVWATLALTMPDVDKSWLQQFCNGFFSLAERHRVQLIGGDTTQGPLTITVQVMGLVPQGQALKRAGAKVGDRVFVSGQLGDAALALQMLQHSTQLKVSDEQKAMLLNKLNRPQPRTELGIALRGIASSVIDVSDGLAADLGHILEVSNVGAVVDVDQLPVSDELIRSKESREIETLALAGGDDYELCFTVPFEKLPVIEQIKQQLKINVTAIGQIEEQQGLRVTCNGVSIDITQTGYRHFSQG